jgi:hypothetical protein
MRTRSTPDERTTTWLLEEEQPSVRYLTLTRLLDKTEKDPEVESARASMVRKGWVADILRDQRPGGWWVAAENPCVPKFVGTNWMLLVLADLGLKADPFVSTACLRWISQLSKPDGGFSPPSWSKSHLCVTGNAARALVQFGYEDHPKVRGAFRWLVENQAEKGGWSCFGSGRNLDSWEPMSALAALPRRKWTKSMKQAVENGAEFYLERELHIQGAHYEPWYRFHYPVHYYYDLLVALDFMTALGYAGDRRLSHAVDVLKKKRRQDGRWVLDALHPDVEGSMKAWYTEHPKDVPVPFSLEHVGEPSKLITLKALQILRRLDGSR